MLLGYKSLESLCQADLGYKGAAFCRGKGAILYEAGSQGLP